MFAGTDVPFTSSNTKRNLPQNATNDSRNALINSGSSSFKFISSLFTIQFKENIRNHFFVLFGLILTFYRPKDLNTSRTLEIGKPLFLTSASCFWAMGSEMVPGATNGDHRVGQLRGINFFGSRVIDAFSPVWKAQIFSYDSPKIGLCSSNSNPVKSYRRSIPIQQPPSSVLPSTFDATDKSTPSMIKNQAIHIYPNGSCSISYGMMLKSSSLSSSFSLPKKPNRWI